MPQTFLIRRCFRDLRKTIVEARGYTHEQAWSRINDPDCASHTATAEDARKFTLRNGPWFDVMEAEPRVSHAFADRVFYMVMGVCTAIILAGVIVIVSVPLPK